MGTPINTATALVSLIKTPNHPLPRPVVSPADRTAADLLWAYPPQHSIHTLPLDVGLAVRRLDEALEELEAAAKRLSDLSWGPGDDGTNPQPVADGMGSAWLEQLKTITKHVDQICEPTRDLGDAWAGYPGAA